MSNHESIIRAFNSRLFCPLGAGISNKILVIKSSMPKPDLALTFIISFSETPVNSDKSFDTDDVSADGRSILFITGIILSFNSVARL